MARTPYVGDRIAFTRATPPRPLLPDPCRLSTRADQGPVVSGGGGAASRASYQKATHLDIRA